MSEDISEGDYKSEHYNCVIDAVSKFWSYRFDLINLWNAPSAKITIQDESGNFKQVTIAEILNQMNFEVYKNIHGSVFKEAIRIRVRRASNHFKSAEKYLSELRSDHGRLVVIRLDLCLPPELKNIDVPELKHNFDRFTQKMRRSRLLKLNGYIWKLEYGFAKSFHYHLIIFLCGRKHSHDIKLAQMIGEMWDKTIGGKNCYFNCHSTKYLKHYKDIVVGRLERNDHIKFDRLLNVVIRYFCKKDQFIVHKSIVNKKTFDTGRTRSAQKPWTSSKNLNFTNTLGIHNESSYYF
ncbi:inovirus-type Gp2 protein [Acinetobacter seifertii]|nr:inovirus-type Gp2 protein [Acinetobacter seifertii]